MVEKVFKIGLAVLIQYRRVTSSHAVTQPRCCSKYRVYYVEQVKMHPICSLHGKNLISFAGILNHLQTKLVIKPLLLTVFAPDTSLQ